MGELQIIFIVLAIIVGIGQVILYLKKDRNDFIFIFNVILALIIAYISYSSFPIEYNTQRIISVILGGLGMISLIPYYVKKNFLISKIMLSASVIGGLLYLFLV